MLTLEDREWRCFAVGELFTLIAGKCNHVSKIRKQDGDGISYLGATNRNNAVLDFVEPVQEMIQKGNCIAFICDGEGSMGYSAYKSEDFIATVNVTLGYAPFMNRYVGLFISTVSDKVRGKYNYNYKRNDARLRKESIMLPVDDDGQPDFAFMEEYMREREEQMIERYVRYIENTQMPCGGGIEPQLDEREWAEFAIRDLFQEIRRGKRLKTADHIKGNIPYVSSSAMNNGVDAFIGNDGNVRKYGNCITIANSGSIGTAFYHYYEFIASDHVTALQSNKLNKDSYLFLIMLISRIQEKYGFNREINDARINREKVMLPVDDEGKPDYEYMERYVRERERQMIERYLEYIKGKR